MEKYNIFVSGELVHEKVPEEEMMEITQDLADDFYTKGFPHPDDVMVEYVGMDEG